MTRTVALCLILLVGILAGCGQKEDGIIRLRYMAWGNIQQLAIEQEMVDKFNAANPDVQVSLFQVPQSAYLNKAIVMFASKTAPDVVRIDRYNTPSLVDRRYFKDLRPYAENDPDFDQKDFWPIAMEECWIDGKLIGLPVLFGGGVIYYNKKMLREAGLEDPFELSMRGEWTWDRMRDHALKMTKFDNRGKPTQYGLNFPVWPYYHGLVRSYGGRILSEDLTRCVADSPETIRAIQYLADLRWKDRVCATPAQGQNAAFTFESGKIGIEFNYMGATARFREVIKDFEWDMAPMPDGPAGPSHFIKGNQLVMYEHSKHPEAAWRFMKFLTNEESERYLHIVRRRTAPSRVKLMKDPDFVKPKEPPYNLESITLVCETGETLPIGPRYSEFTAAWNMELDNLFAGREKDAAAVVKRATAAVNKVLAEEPGF